MERNLTGALIALIVIIWALLLPLAIQVSSPVLGDWEWYNPYPSQGNCLYGVWGSSGSDVFVVGDNTILHYNGSTWQPMTSNTKHLLNGVCGSSGSDVFAVGNNTILHYDGTKWSPMRSNTGAVSGNVRSGSSEVYLTDVWESAADDVFAVGFNGTIIHYDGATWHPMVSDTTADFRGVWGSSDSDVFAIGDRTILHYDGTKWSTMTGGPKSEAFFDIWGSAANDVFVVGINGVVIHYDGTTWSNINNDIQDTLYSVWGSSNRDVYAVGSRTFHFDGTKWSQVVRGPTSFGSTGAIWGSSGNDIFAVSGTTILHYNGTNWSPMSVDTNHLNGIRESSENNASTVDSGGILPNSSSRLTAPTGTPPQDPIQTGVGVIVSWFTENLPWIIVSTISIAAVCLIIWRLKANGFEFDAVIKIILAATAVLILSTLFVFFTQQFLTYLLFALVVVTGLAIGLRKGPGPPDNPPSTISKGNKIYEIYTEDTHKAKAHAIVRSLKRQGYFAFVRSYRARFRYEESGVEKTVNNYIVYRCPK